MWLKLNFRGVLSTFVGLEHRFGLEAENRSPDVAGEAKHLVVVSLNYFIVALALSGDAVLGGFELGLQAQEVGVGLQFGISLVHGVDIDVECAFELRLSCLILLDVGLGRVGGNLVGGVVGL